MDINTPEGGGVVWRLCKEIEAQYKKDRDFNRFQIALAYAQVHPICLSEMWPETEPYPTEEIAAILNASPREKEKIDWKADPIWSHLNEVQRIRNKNKAIVECLKDTKKLIPLSDNVTHKKIDDQLALFGVRIAHPESYLEHSVKETA